MKTNTLENTLPQVKKEEHFSTVHYMAEFYSPQFVEDPKDLEEILYRAAIAANNTPLKCSIHKFPGHGITGVLILAESHIAIHTWPEYDYLAIDVFTCGKASRPPRALDYLEEIFMPQETKIQRVNRGTI